MEQRDDVAHAHRELGAEPVRVQARVGEQVGERLHVVHALAQQDLVRVRVGSGFVAFETLALTLTLTLTLTPTPTLTPNPNPNQGEVLEGRLLEQLEELEPGGRGAD